MAQAERTTPEIELVHGNLADFLLETHLSLGKVVRVEGFQVGQDLTLEKRK